MFGIRRPPQWKATSIFSKYDLARELRPETIRILVVQMPLKLFYGWNKFYTINYCSVTFKGKSSVSHLVCQFSEIERHSREHGGVVREKPRNNRVIQSKCVSPIYIYRCEWVFVSLWMCICVWDRNSRIHAQLRATIMRRSWKWLKLNQSIPFRHN